MANKEHVALLNQGVDDWNTWRGTNPNVYPDLAGANLFKADLLKANLTRADLTKANVTKADLRWADLAEANLTGADLHEANLTGVDFTGANLHQTDLFRTNLSEAILTKADLGGVNLFKADLIGARLSGTILHRANLGEANLHRAKLHKANIREADLHGANLSEADLGEADLTGADLFTVNLRKANLRGTNFYKAKLTGADLHGADLTGANLGGANLPWVNLARANLTEANLSGANLRFANLVETNLTNADLTSCRIYGISAWGLKLRGAKQESLVITARNEPEITVDNIEVAQFVYLLLHNEKIRDAIDTIGRKGVLLLGRFTDGRVDILERLRTKLRELGYVPMVFNFDKPETKDFTETVRLLAGLSHFVIVDITNPRATPLELQATVPDCMVPFVPILEKGEEPFSMFRDLWIKHRQWVLAPIRYSSVDRLLEVLEIDIVKPAEARFAELLAKKADEYQVKDV
jgi:uncharacterized protein YjbI with pentapeptide repeats